MVIQRLIIRLISLYLILASCAAVPQPPALIGVEDLKLAAEFLITVNDTWQPHCIITVKTPMLISGVKYNQSDSIAVGSCDHGPMRFEIKTGNDNNKFILDITFYSSVLEDASPPTCSINWNGTYLTPSREDVSQSLLPGCFVMDSREGYHMTYFWFYLLSWTFQ